MGGCFAKRVMGARNGVVKPFAIWISGAHVCDVVGAVVLGVEFGQYSSSDLLLFF